ncbi:alpha/beta fold hydrolase [Pseudomonas aeruginosa]|uniref:alpha/beta fold hydrolase n=1 Tax=Pseudomonas aeruginosa TaxID=287 RepID=UPI001F245C5A|nr:alpha/beta fold hydrolase [Pseudomonas aeruginosa]MDI2556825.1 alpha/beta hydrolase [Pseudomonas aeruginosa]
MKFFHIKQIYKACFIYRANEYILETVFQDVFGMMNKRRGFLRKAPIATIFVLATTLMMGVIASAAAQQREGGLMRQDFRVSTADGVALHVREVRGSGAIERPALILVHGARVPGIGSFDLDVPNGSLAGDLARLTGRAIFILDARGYGQSDRPTAMDHPTRESKPLSRAYEVIRDIDAVAAIARQRTGIDQVALLGWATGGMWAAYYASLWPEHVSELITFNALYGGSGKHEGLGLGSSNDDPVHSGRFNSAIGGYALNTAASLLPSWDKTIPVQDKTEWRGPLVTEAYARAALSSDPQSGDHQPPAFRAPLGAMEDSFYQATGRRLFDAASIRAAVLVVRSEHDFWSRPEDAENFVHDAVHAESIRAVTLANATHYAHLDRPERGRSQFIDEVVKFLAGERQ